MKTAVWCVCLAMVSGFVVAGSSGSPGEIETGKGSATIVPIEHATFVIEWAGMTVLVDPIGGAGVFADHGAPDLILITDIHRDHFDSATVTGLMVATTEIVAPAAVAGKFPETQRQRVSVLANGQTREWHGNLIEAVPMYNLDPEKQKFHPKGRGNGYVLTLGGTRIYIAGDTADIPEMRALEDIDAAFVCMNLPYTMDVEAAASAVLEFRPKVVFPYHYRGTDGMSDIDLFRQIVSKDPTIEVRFLDWY